MQNESSASIQEDSAGESSIGLLRGENAVGAEGSRAQRRTIVHAVALASQLWVVCLLGMLLFFTWTFVPMHYSVVMITSETALVFFFVFVAPIRVCQKEQQLPPLQPLARRSVADFARQELNLILPNKFGGRFFLAGGAFKSLIHGESPHDLDLWPASESDRILLLAALEEQGCTKVEDGPFNSKLVHNRSRRKVEVTIKCFSTMMSCISQFDLNLSCIACEYNGGEVVDTYVTQGAIDDVLLSEITVVTELFRHEYNLQTIGRIDRYAGELGFSVADSARVEMWQIYQDATVTERTKLLINARMSESDLAQWCNV
jgi:hypothetical protein